MTKMLVVIDLCAVKERLGRDLLDEPFRGLDAETKKKTMDYIRRKGKEKTMLLVTHDLEEAEEMGDWICTCSRLDGTLEIKKNRKSSTEI